MQEGESAPHVLLNTCDNLQVVYSVKSKEHHIVQPKSRECVHLMRKTTGSCQLDAFLVMVCIIHAWMYLSV